MSSKHSSSQQGDTPITDDPNFWPIACVLCNRIHKKHYLKSVVGTILLTLLELSVKIQCVDKKLPSCSRCAQKGTVCEYKEPVFKRKTQIVSSSADPFLSLNYHQQQQQQTNRPIISIFNSQQELDESATQIIQSIKQNTIEAYCLIVCNGSPPFRPEDLSKLLTNGQEILKRKDILALMISIQGCVELIFGFSDLAEESFNKARDLIMPYFDDFENPLAACTYTHIGLFNATIGKTSKSRGYLHLCEQYLVNWKQRNPNSVMTTDQPFVENAGGYGIAMNVPNLRVQNMVVELISCETHPVPDIKTLERISMDILGCNLPDQLKDFFKTHQFATSNLNPSNIDETLRAFEVFVGLLHYSVRPTFRSEFSVKIHHMNFLVLVNGLRILYLLISGCDISTAYNTMNAENIEQVQLLEYAALTISKLTEDELFVFICPYLISFLLVAVRTNLEICKMIERGERKNLKPIPPKKERICLPNVIKHYEENELVDYYSVVGKDLRALQVMSKRYRYIAPYTKELEEFLGGLSERQNNLNQQQQFWSIMGQPLIEEPSYIINGNGEIIYVPNQQYQKKDTVLETSKMNRVGSFYNAMKDFLLKFNNRIEDAFENKANQSPTFSMTSSNSSSSSGASPGNFKHYLETKLNEINVQSLSDLELLLSHISTQHQQPGVNISNMPLPNISTNNNINNNTTTTNIQSPSTTISNSPNLSNTPSNGTIPDFQNPLLNSMPFSNNNNNMLFTNNSMIHPNNYHTNIPNNSHTNIPNHSNLPQHFQMNQYQPQLQYYDPLMVHQDGFDVLELYLRQQQDEATRQQQSNLRF